jgi:UDP-N-acetylmuramate--alanine ligase
MKKVHFIGIGGIGMSALARWYLSLGYTVTGSDRSKSENIENLIKHGVIFKEGEDDNFITPDLEKVVYTIAISEENSELKKAKGILATKTYTYPEALGQMTTNKKVIAVCGTHGKTTTTAMTYFALQNAGVDVSMILGSLIDHDGEKTNYVHGESEWIVIEACEYKRSFLNYNPDIVMLTNIDNDHLDYFKNAEDTKSAFQEFVNIASLKNGTLITHIEFSDLVIANKIISEDVMDSESIELSVPGRHNRKNAQLVVALGKFLNLDSGKILSGLKNFKGTWRRQEYKGEFFGNTFYDDYGHHPTEIRATLNAFREKFPDKKILAIFQPHLYSRTKLLLEDFANAFLDADEVILLPIYAAREKNDETISSEILAEKIKGKDAKVVKTFEELLSEIKTKQDFCIVTLGAGDINKIYTYLK